MSPFDFLTSTEVLQQPELSTGEESAYVEHLALRALEGIDQAEKEASGLHKLIATREIGRAHV